jgi:hypothetical protein
MKRELFVCNCGDIDHQFVVVSPPEEWAIDYPEEEGEIWIHIHLRQDLTFLQRLKYAILYLFGKQSIYGAFGEIILSKSERERLRLALELPCDKETN